MSYSEISFGDFNLDSNLIIFQDKLFKKKLKQVPTNDSFKGGKVVVGNFTKKSLS